MPAEEVARMHHLDPQAGLTSAEAKRVRERVGANVLAGIEPRSRLQILADQIFTAPTALLTAAAGLSLLLGDVLEAGAIVAVVGSNAVIGYYTESRAEELLHAWGSLRVERARVLRGGRTVSLSASELVPGDLLLIQAGDAIAADARILEAHDLTVDESMLTGESEAAEKSAAPVSGDAPLADRQSMLYAGTVVASGHGQAVVVAVGQGTELGNIQRALLRAEDRAAPLEQELGAIGHRLAGLALASSAAVVGVGLLRGQPLRALAKSAVALGVAAIPEGFPTVGTTALALASRKLYRRGIVIRRLAAAETLGAVSVICADKTGTLTENRMRVAELFLPGEGIVRVSWEAAAEKAVGKGGRAAGGVALLTSEGSVVARDRVHEIARIAALNADVEIASGKVTLGSGTEAALVDFALAVGYPVDTRRNTARRVGEERRSAEHPFMVTVHDHPELGRIELVKGAPEHVLLRCPLGDEARVEALRQNEAMASQVGPVATPHAFVHQDDGTYAVRGQAGWSNWTSHPPLPIETDVRWLTGVSPTELVASIFESSKGLHGLGRNDGSGAWAIDSPSGATRTVLSGMSTPAVSRPASPCSSPSWIVAPIVSIVGQPLRLLQALALGQTDACDQRGVVGSPEEVAAVGARATRLAREERFPSVAAMLEAIQRLVRDTTSRSRHSHRRDPFGLVQPRTDPALQ
jgi:Ca2+-transporting ATPase